MIGNDITTEKSAKAAAAWIRAGCQWPNEERKPDAPTPAQWREIRKRERIAENNEPRPRITRVYSGGLQLTGHRPFLSVAT